MVEQPAEPGEPTERPEQHAIGGTEEPNIHQVQAAAYADLANGLTHIAETMARAVEQAHPEFTGPAAEQAKQAFDELTTAIPKFSKAMADRMRLVGQANAAMSFAYQELMASGGPDNPEALARYREADQWYGELLNAERPEGDSWPQS